MTKKLLNPEAQAVLDAIKQHRDDEATKIANAKEVLDPKYHRYLTMLQSSVVVGKDKPLLPEFQQLGAYHRRRRDDRSNQWVHDVRINVANPYMPVEGRTVMATDAVKDFIANLLPTLTAAVEAAAPEAKAAALAEMAKTLADSEMSVTHEFVDIPGLGLHAKTTVRVPGLGSADGLARVPMPKAGGYSAEDTNPVEVATTSSMGRALGALGFGLFGTGLASAEEVEQAIKTQEAIRKGLEGQGAKPQAEQAPASEAQSDAAEPELPRFIVRGEVKIDTAVKGRRKGEQYAQVVAESPEGEGVILIGYDDALARLKAAQVNEVITGQFNRLTDDVYELLAPAS